MINIKKISLTQILVIAFFLFLPFERLLTFELFGLTLKISFIILMAIILSYFILRPEPKFAVEEKALLFFIALSYLSVFWSIDQLRSLIISTIFFATIFGFITLRRFINSKNLEILKTIIIYSGILLSFFALWQYFADLNGLSQTFLRASYTKAVFGFPRPQATFLEPLYFANYLFLPIFFTIERAFKANKNNWFLLSSILLLISVFILTLSRGAYIGIAIALLFFASIIIYKFRSNLTRFYFVLAAIIFGLIAGVAIIYFSAPSQSFGLFVEHASISDVNTGESTLDRFQTMKIAWDSFLKTPMGVGAGAFGALPEFNKKLLAGEYQTVNNLYLEVLVEEGIVGFGIFLFFLFLILKTLWKRVMSGNFDALCSLAAFIAISVQAITFSSLYILPIWAFFALAWPKTRQTN